MRPIKFNVSQTLIRRISIFRQLNNQPRNQARHLHRQLNNSSHA